MREIQPIDSFSFFVEYQKEINRVANMILTSTNYSHDPLSQGVFSTLEDSAWESFTLDDGSISFRLKQEKISSDTPCYHTWEQYLGFTEMYRYCSNCDKKEYG